MSIFGETQKTKSARFPQPGAQVEGSILEIGDPIQARKWTPDGTGDPDTWPDGQPKMQAAIKLQTEGRDPEDPEDDGVRNLWVPVAGARKPGSMLNAINTAVAATGNREPAIGGTLAVRYVQNDPQSKNPQNPRKMYQARYTAPSSGDWGDGWDTAGQGQQQGGGQPGAAPQPAPQPDPWADPAPAPQSAPQPAARPAGVPMTPDQEAMVDAMLAGGINPEQIKAAAGVTDHQLEARRAVVGTQQTLGGTQTGDDDQPPY